MNSLLSELQALEVELHHPGVRCDATRLDQLLHQDFHEVGRSGRKYDRATVFKFLAGQQTPPATESSAFAACMIGPDLALLTYCSAHRGDDGNLTNHTLRSSMWVRIGTAWQLRFHQGTPAAEPWQVERKDRATTTQTPVMMSPPPSEPMPVSVPALQWAEEHPSFFFADGKVTAESLANQLVAGATALGAEHVEVRAVGRWLVVASSHDWFASASFPMPEDLAFQALTPFPELGQNCIRPECLVAAFAESTVVCGPAGMMVVKGKVDDDDPVLAELSNPEWRRAIAFRPHDD